MDNKIAEQKAKQAFCLIDPKLNCKHCQWDLICKPRIDAILALIEQEQKPMVEALKEAIELIPHDIDNFFPMECNSKKCHHCLMRAKIDAVLPKGEGK